MNNFKEQDELINEVLNNTKGKLIKSVYTQGLKDPEDLVQELKVKVIEVVREDKIKEMNFDEFVELKRKNFTNEK